MKQYGAIFVIASGVLLGISAYRTLLQNLREIQRCRRLLERLHTEICIRRSSLPEAVRECGGEQLPSVMPGEIWERFVISQCITGESRDAFSELGERLRRGDEPERAFSSCREALSRFSEEAENTLRQKGRLYAALGASAGLIVTILLI